MKQRSTRAVLTACAVAVVLAVGACSGDSDDSAAPSGATATSAAADFESGKTQQDLIEGEAPTTTTAPDLPKPAAEELNGRINRAFDRSVGAQEKSAWIQDAERDPQLVDKLVDAAERNKVTVRITGVGDPKDGKLKADAEVTIGGAPVQDAFVEFVAEDDQWKVSNQFTCTIVRNAKLDSAACQAR
ncbi:hypothetical protein ACTD5D_12525 [Nocardia takedensis]|uniref:hypothetical protein n=1 Tax=Nocardia takedensis TaxID=259390 RepID=UPI0005942B1E|nr:hypothetical protein [Nocardia takedensis]